MGMARLMAPAPEVKGSPMMSSQALEKVMGPDPMGTESRARVAERAMGRRPGLVKAAAPVEETEIKAGNRNLSKNSGC